MTSLFNSIDSKEIYCLDLSNPAFLIKGKLNNITFSNYKKNIIINYVKKIIRPIKNIFMTIDISKVEKDILLLNPDIIYSMLGDLLTIKAILKINKIIPTL